jgi:hypothetical protein
VRLGSTQGVIKWHVLEQQAGGIKEAQSSSLWGSKRGVVVCVCVGGGGRRICDHEVLQCHHSGVASWGCVAACLCHTTPRRPHPCCGREFWTGGSFVRCSALGQWPGRSESQGELGTPGGGGVHGFMQCHHSGVASWGCVAADLCHTTPRRLHPCCGHGHNTYMIM